MDRRASSFLYLVLFCLTGCLYPVSKAVDDVVCDLSMLSRDLQPVEHASPMVLPDAGNEATPDGSVKAQLGIPLALQPGGAVPPLTLPPLNEANSTARKQAIEQLFPPLPPLGDDPPDSLASEGRPLCLADLQRLAIANSPVVKQAAARVEEARGRAVQAGLMPNPTVGFEADTTGTTGGAGYVGAFLEQKVTTSNKLQLSRAAATLDVKLAELDLIDTQATLATKVRSGFFAVLVAQESVRLNRALVKFTSDVYSLQIDLVRRGFASPYEPMYLRALSTQARAALVQARNRRVASWKLLAASLGLPGMPPTQLAGRLDVPVPVFVHQAVLAKALSSHTDIRSAEVALAQAQLHLELQRRTPIPDVNLRVMLQKDNTGVPFQNSPSVAVSVPVPVWDRNQGNILSAQAAIERVRENMHKARVELTSQLAEAFERYENNRVLLGYYRDQILPDLVRVYRGVYERYQQDAGGAAQAPAFTDIVVAQQNLAQAVATYITTLGNQWQAVVDVADVTQTFDLFGLEGPTHPVAAIPDLERLPPLPCCHPCAPYPLAYQTVLDKVWPSAERAVPTQKAILPPAVESLPPPTVERSRPDEPSTSPEVPPPLNGEKLSQPRKGKKKDETPPEPPSTAILPPLPAPASTPVTLSRPPKVPAWTGAK